MAVKKPAEKPKVGKSGFSDITVSKAKVVRGPGGNKVIKGKSKGIEVKSNGAAARRTVAAGKVAGDATKYELIDNETLDKDIAGAAKLVSKKDKKEFGITKSTVKKSAATADEMDAAARAAAAESPNVRKAKAEIKGMASIPTANSEQQSTFNLASAINTLKPNSVNKSKTNVHVFGPDSNRARTHIAQLGPEHHTGCGTKGCNNLVPTAFGDAVCPTCSAKDDAKFEAWAKSTGQSGASATKMYKPAD